MKYKLNDEEVLKKIKPWLYLVTYTLLLAFFLYNIKHITNGLGFIISLFRSLLYAIVFAYILNLPMKKIESWIMTFSKETSFIYRKRRVFSMLLTFFSAILIIVFISFSILPSIIDSLISLIQNLSTFFVNIIKNIDAILLYFHINVRLEDIQSINEFVKMPWDKIFSNTITILSGSASGILSGATNFISASAVAFSGFIFSLYLLSGKESFLRQLRKVTAAFCGYKTSLTIFSYATRVNRIFAKFIGGQLTEACILWVLYYVSMRIFNFPFPELISTLIAICSLVPIFGPMFAMCIGAIMMLSTDPLSSLWFILFYQVISYFEDNVIYPRVVGNSVGLPGLWVLVCIFVFGNLWGVFGMIMAVPTTACFYVFFVEYVDKRLDKKHLYVSEDEIILKDDEVKKAMSEDEIL